MLNEGVNSAIRRLADRYRLELRECRLLLLAIDPSSNKLFPGIDDGEILPGGSIPIRNIYILNGQPELVRRILGLELGPFNTGRSFTYYEALTRWEKPYAYK